MKVASGYFPNICFHNERFTEIMDLFLLRLVCKNFWVSGVGTQENVLKDFNNLPFLIL
jgi:hypothetical protein